MEVVYTLDALDLESVWTNGSDGTITSGPTTGAGSRVVTVELPARAVVQEALLKFTCGAGSGYYPTTHRVSCGDITHNIVTGENYVNFSTLIRSTGVYTFSFVYRSRGATGWSAGKHTARVDYTNMSLTVQYTMPGSSGDDEEEALVSRPFRTASPEDSITLCDGGTRGILAVLHPQECTVTEQAGGEWELQMVYPTNDDVWQMITPDRIIRAPVPKHTIPAIVVENPVFYEVVNRTTLWKKIPSQYTKKANSGGSSSGAEYTVFVPGRVYHRGDKVVYNGIIFVCNTDTFSGSTMLPKYWVIYRDGSTEGTGSSSNNIVKVPGVKIEDLEPGTLMVKIDDLNSAYMRVRTQNGTMGYVKTSDCQVSQQSWSGTVYNVKERTVTRQYFRIYATSLSSYDHTLTVNARHISYDLDAIRLGKCNVIEADPTLAINFMLGSFIGGDNVDARVIATDIKDGTITQNWTHASPVNAILDPDSGIVSTLKARLFRDDDDIIILRNDSPYNGVNITYGKNLLGVEVETDLSELITRITPIAKDRDGGEYYLPEVYIDSALIERYAFIHHEVLEVNEQLGKDYTPTGQSQSVPMDETTLNAKMREAVGQRYIDERCDLPHITVTVEFCLLGDSEEYKEYRGLQYVNLYDIVRVIHPELGVDVNTQVTEYEWDAILRRYNFITLGDPYEYGGGTVAGYQIGNRAIQLRSLSPALKEALNL